MGVFTLTMLVTYLLMEILMPRGARLFWRSDAEYFREMSAGASSLCQTRVQLSMRLVVELYVLFLDAEASGTAEIRSCIWRN